MAARLTLERVLAKLDIPRDYAAVLGVGTRGDGGVEVHLSPGMFRLRIRARRRSALSPG